MAISNPELLLTTAGGRICCARCTAQSTRSGEQCKKPALKSSRTQKCTHHGGGLTSGKQTEEGRSRIASAPYKHGGATKAARQQYSADSARLNQLEDAMYVLGMSTAPRTRGRKPNGYQPVRTMSDVVQMALDMEKHRAGGSGKEP